jgi:MOSC domain-containing protein YiiM
MAVVQSVNVGAARPIAAKSGRSGIDKRPTDRPVRVFAPGPKGPGGSGVEGDVICDRGSHGGDTQAVYAFAREDLDWWERELGVPLRSGWFGENLTTQGQDVTEALAGEEWEIGDEVVLQVTGPRIPCKTFSVWMQDRGWLRQFTRRARPGAYLRVVAPGRIRAGDPIRIRSRPDHRVTIGTMFRALTLESRLLPDLLEASDFLEDEIIERARRRQPFSVV